MSDDAPDDIPPAAAAVPLPYADVVTARGVTLDRDGDTLHIRLPVAPARRWSWALAAVALTACSAFAVAALAVATYRAGIDFVVMSMFCTIVPVVVVLGLSVGAINAARVAFTGHQIRVTPTSLTVRTLDLIGARDLSRPRAAITDLRFNPFDNALLLRANGYELVLGLFRGQDPRVLEWIAHALRAELGLPEQ